MIVHPGGVAKPAAFIIETLQCEGGLNLASNAWLQQLADIAKRNEILLIVDEVQVGCGRTGTFFSFERANIVPDMVCLSKSISGMGLAMALLLLKPELDIWSPGEHNGTFRGNNMAFVAATSAIENYWQDLTFTEHIAQMTGIMTEVLEDICSAYPSAISQTLGLGLVQGIKFNEPEMASKVAKLAFEAGLIIESCGPDSEVIKMMPPLIITEQPLREAGDILKKALAQLTA
jgi:diaminobutyrate-2-oxoglutarate transaminase